MLSLVQIEHSHDGRAVAVVRDSQLLVLPVYRSCYELALSAISNGVALHELLSRSGVREKLSWDEVYSGRSVWRLLPAFDHPSEPARCLVSGTGLTHLSSAATRQAMHGNAETETDSMRMYRWGIEGGRPAEDAIGIAPEWFYKGDGGILRAHNQPLTVPWFAEDGGEEPEIAGVYVIDPMGSVVRVGMAIGNEFSDHRFERRNYLYLAHSKLRECSIGPELIVDPNFSTVVGEVKIEREGSILWSREITSGAERMCHSLGNLEHHHFKYEQHRRPGDVHIHFFGADGFSFGAGIELRSGDVMEIGFDGFGRSLRNPLALDNRRAETIKVRAI